MRKVLKRLAIVAAMVSSLTLLGTHQASADDICARAATRLVEVSACVPLL